MREVGLGYPRTYLLNAPKRTRAWGRVCVGIS